MVVVPGVWQWVGEKLSIFHLSETTGKIESNSGGKGWWRNDLEEAWRESWLQSRGLVLG